MYVRREEHKVAVKQKAFSSSLAQRSLLTGHKINFDGTKTIANIENLKPRTIREAIEIGKRPECLNKRDDA